MATTSAAWENVKEDSRKLSNGPLSSISPTKSLKFSKFQDASAPINLNLDGNQLIFENHTWRLASQSGEVINQQFTMLKDQNKQLQEENQMLKFKLEILLDMLSGAKLDLLNSELEKAQR